MLSVDPAGERLRSVAMAVPPSVALVAGLRFAVLVAGLRLAADTVARIMAAGGDMVPEP